MSTIDLATAVDASTRTTAGDEQLREARVLVPTEDFGSIGIEGLVSLLRAAELRHFEALSCHERGAVIEAEVGQRMDAGALAELAPVESWQLLSTGEQPTYVMDLAAPAFLPSIAARTEGVIDSCDPSLTRHGLGLTLVGSQSAIAEAVETCQGSGASPELLKLGAYDGPESPLAMLTERQREVVKTAYEIGYYEIPREVSTEHLAAEVGIDPSTVSEHLRRAERNLLTGQLEPAERTSVPVPVDRQ